MATLRIDVHSLFVAAVLAVAAQSTLAAGPATTNGVGVVAEYRPASARYTWARPSRSAAVPVQIGAIVVAGDRIVLPVGGSVTLQLASGKREDFKGPGTFTVPDAGALGRLGSVFDSLSHVFDDEFRLSGTAASRGGETCRADGSSVATVRVPILADSARIEAGTRDIPLAWRGGCPPFTVSVVAADQRIVRRESVEGWQVRLDAVPLTPGQYDVRIADATGRSYTGTLEAVRAAPAIPPDLAADDSAIGVAAQAMWLASQDGGRWRIDGFDRLRPLIRAGDPLAGSLGDGLLWGAAPSTTR
jgi:hypothetical protein